MLDLFYSGEINPHTKISKEALVTSGVNEFMVDYALK